MLRRRRLYQLAKLDITYRPTPAGVRARIITTEGAHAPPGDSPFPGPLTGVNPCPRPAPPNPLRKRRRLPATIPTAASPAATPVGPATPSPAGLPNSAR